VAYEDRFIGPFAAALPKTDAPDKPDLYALPGNHDWYDGLVTFLRVFCVRDGRVGNWVTRQRRSYFALKLPHDWWGLGNRHPARHVHRRRAAGLLPPPEGPAGRQDHTAHREAELGERVWGGSSPRPGATSRSSKSVSCGRAVCGSC